MLFPLWYLGFLTLSLMHPSCWLYSNGFSLSHVILLWEAAKINKLPALEKFSFLSFFFFFSL